MVNFGVADDVDMARRELGMSQSQRSMPRGKRHDLRNKLWKEASQPGV
jgi:hypothetical protein